MTLPAVTNLQVTSAPGVLPIVLTWTGVDSAVHGGHRYAIYRKLSTQAWPSTGGTPIAYVTAPTTTYTDSTATAGRTYNYRVRHTFGSAAEWCEVIAKGPNYLDVNRITSNSFGPHSHAAGEPFDLDAASGWNRPFGAFPASVSGRLVNDPGIANGFKDRSVDWRPTGGAHASFRGGYLGHPEYEAQFDALWPVQDYDNDSRTRGLTFTNTYDGNEFWVQWRMYISAGRLAATASSGKLFYMQTCSSTSACQLYFNLTPATDGAQLNFEHDGQPGIGGGIHSMPPIDPTTGQRYLVLPDQWVTYMMHVIPGRVTLPEGTLELLVSEPGATSWKTIYSNTAFPFHYNWDYPGGTFNHGSQIQNPPGYNSFRCQVYGNHYEGSSSSGASGNSFYLGYTQIIVSTQPIPRPQT